MAETKWLPQRVAARIKNFIVQTFRRHTLKEYSEFVSRGARGEVAVNRQYPWAYIRLFSLLFVLYAVFLLIIRFTDNELFTPTVIVFASLMFNLPFLTLLYELNPKSELSFASLVLILLIGGTVADVITQVLYSVFETYDKWLSAVYAGVFEEFAKGFVTVAAIIILKNKSPFVGFLIGAAVGCGFSISEDMGYIFLESGELLGLNVTPLIGISVSRGVSSFFSHIVWSGAIGWAFSSPKIHIKNVLKIFVVALNVGLHIVWDLPLDPVLSLFVIIGCSIVAIAECIPMLVYERRKVFREEGAESVEEQINFFTADEASLDKRKPEFYAHAGNLSLTICSVLMAVVAVIYCAIPFKESTFTTDFYASEELIEYMQCGLPLEIDETRQYVPSLGNVKEEREDGVLVSVEQKERSGDYDYYYTYNVVRTPAAENEFYFLTEISVDVNDGTGTYRYFKEDLYNNGKKYASFFRIRENVTGFTFGYYAHVTVHVNNPEFERDLMQPQYMTLFIIFGALAAAGLISFGGCMITSAVTKRKYKETDKDE